MVRKRLCRDKATVGTFLVLLMYIMRSNVLMLVFVLQDNSNGTVVAQTWYLG